MTAESLERIEGFRDKWPFAARYVRVNGWRMHYIDEGAGDPVLLLHGNPTWGFLYCDVIPPLLSTGHRVIVPDMIGFGLSEKPAREQAHSLDGHIANLTGLVRQLDLGRVTVVCHDWGGPTGLSFAMSNPERVRALTVMSTWAWPTPPAEFHTRLFPWRTMHAPLVGPYLLGRHNVRKTEAMRRALVLTEDRLGHYPEFRAFFAQTFGLDRVGLSEPGFVRAPSGMAYALVFIGRSGEAFPSGLEIYAVVDALESFDDAAVDQDLWAILGWMIGGVGASSAWRRSSGLAG